MAVAFEETMQGWMTLAGATERHELSFTIHARNPSAMDHFRTGHVDVTGVIRAAPLVERAVVTGSLLIRPVGQRLLGYQLNFANADGNPLRFAGKKQIAWSSPVRSWTTLPFQILANDKEVASGVVVFDIKRDWWSFSRSFWV
jgi:hypothetical protein